MTLDELRMAQDEVERVTVADFPSVGSEYWTVLDIYCQPAIVASAHDASCFACL